MRRLPPAERDAFRGRLNEHFLPLMYESVTPLFIQRGDGLFLHGTGTLFRVGDAHFVVTAEHVAAHRADSRPLYMADTVVEGAPMDPVPVGGRAILQDGFDVAAVELSPATVRRLPNRRFLGLGQADREAAALAADAMYWVHGYPTCMGDDGVAPATLGFECCWYEADAYGGDGSRFGVAPGGSHVLLRLPDDEPDALRHPERRIAGLTGISGSSLWRVAASPAAAAGWTDGDVRVIAVQTGVHVDRGDTLVKGTRWIVVAHLIWLGCPHLRGDPGLAACHEALLAALGGALPSD